MKNLKKVFVFVPEGEMDHVCACITQGLCELGIQVASNVDVVNSVSRGISQPFSRLKKPELFNVSEHRNDEDFLIVATPSRISNWFDTVEAVAKFKKVAFVNMHDNANYIDYDDSVYAFVTHVNRFATRYGRIFPMGFSLSRDIIDLSNSIDLAQPRSGFVFNFNKTFNQEVRMSLDLALVEGMERLFEVDRKHLPANEYALQLSRSLGVFAYGGSYGTNYLDYGYMANLFAADPERYKLYNFKSFTKDTVVFRWDSWRFWESAVLGAAPFQLDFDKYGFELPVAPKPWVEYIPVDMSNVSNLPQLLADRVSYEPDFFERIGCNARDWAIKNYAPSAVAKYVLSKCGFEV
jgi:hypothetical protein